MNPENKPKRSQKRRSDICSLFVSVAVCRSSPPEISKTVSYGIGGGPDLLLIS
jgi:hypothetical protein